MTAPTLPAAKDDDDYIVAQSDLQQGGAMFQRAPIVQVLPKLEARALSGQPDQKKQPLKSDQ